MSLPVLKTITAAGLAIAFTTLPYHQAMAQELTPVDSIVAVVEEDVILQSELERSLATVTQQIQASGQTPPAKSVLERQVLERLAVDRLQLQRAQATNIRVADQEIDRYIQQIAAQSRITLEQMQQTIIADGISWAEFRNDIREQLAIQRLRQRVAGSRINVSETEIDMFMENSDEKPSEFKLSHILVSLPEGASPEQIRGGRDKVATVLKELDDGMDFATAAITYSDGQRALQGGDLGWRKPEELPPAFAEAIGTLEPGATTKPIRSPSGFHILQIDEFREAKPRMVQEYNALHIMIAISELVDQDEAESEARKLHEEIAAGADFGELAKEHSDDMTSANLGGDLGWFEPASYGPAVAQMLTKMSEGQISEPFRSQTGWHILKHRGTREMDRTKDFARGKAREAIFERKSEEEIELWIRQLRDEAFIEYRLG